MTDAIPDFIVKKSKRAKHVRLTVTGQGRLVIVVPYAFNIKDLPKILESKRTWINKSIEKLTGLNNLDSDRALLHDHNLQIPEKIEFRAIDAVFNLEIIELQAQQYPENDSRHSKINNSMFDIVPKDLRYQGKSTISKNLPEISLQPYNRIRVKELKNHTLLLQIDSYDTKKIIAAIHSWLAKKARYILTPWLLDLAAERELVIKSVSIRSQRTRWASCSMSGTISLNKSLLFLPPDLVTHIMLHELCHIREMNHSQRFWNLLESEDPNTKIAKARLKKGWQLVPKWAVNDIWLKD